MSYPGGYELTRAIELAELCWAGHAQEEAFREGRSWTAPDGYSLRGELPAAEPGAAPLGFVARRDEVIYVVWRASESLEDWMANARFEQAPCRFARARVERRFQEAYWGGEEAGCARSRLWELVAGGKPGAAPSLTGREGDPGETEDPVTQCYLTGHGHGAALAHLSALDLALSARPGSPGRTAAVYSFASPRVGDPDFVDAYQARVKASYRIYNTNDAVPREPPAEILGLRYEHVGAAVPITFGGSPHWNREADHSLAEYLAKLREIAARA